MDSKIKAKVAKTFKSNPKAKKYHVCDDGQCFESSDHARGHQMDINGKLENVQEVSREEVLKADKPAKEDSEETGKKAESKKSGGKNADSKKSDSKKSEGTKEDKTQKEAAASGADEPKTDEKAGTDTEEGSKEDNSK